MAITNLPSGTAPISDHSFHQENGDECQSNLGNNQSSASEETLFPIYKVKLSSRFLFLSLLMATIPAFMIGRASSFMLCSLGKNDLFIQLDKNEKDGLPIPKLLGGKKVPSTLYTSKNFGTSIGSGCTSVYLESNVNNKNTIDTCGSYAINSDTSSGNKISLASTPSDDHIKCHEDAENDNDDSNDDDDDEHLPAGQHLLIDIKNVDALFLNSQIRLAQAMIEVVNESNLTLLSYHCHKLAPMGVSCVGVLLESHIAFHTWPADGVITLDLFTCGSGELVPVLPIVTRLFAIPMNNNGERGDKESHDEPHVVWTHKLRGFNPTFAGSPLAADLGEYILENSSLDLKVEVGSTHTYYQRIDIYDSIDANDVNYLSNSHYRSYLKSLSNDGSYESLHPEFFAAEREIYLDGVLQSTRSGNEAYHESLVHPAMFSHPNPERVSIIGGGEGATLREVLKHSSLKCVNMIEIDEEMVRFSRKHLPDWNRCDDIEKSTEWCGDDSRANMFYEDALAWFLRRFSGDPFTATNESEKPFDVIIVDALDPQDDVPFAEVLYNDAGFFRTLYNGLTDNGILVLQLGEAPDHSSPAEAVSGNSKRDFVMKQLAKLFQSSHVYVEGNCGFRAPWSFVVAFKGKDSEKLWYRNAAEIDIDIQKRVLKTLSGTPTLKYFDGAILESLYQNPTKGFESVHCRATPIPNSCMDRFSGNEFLNHHDPYVSRHLHKVNKEHKDKFIEAICQVESQARRLGFIEPAGEWGDMCLHS